MNRMRSKFENCCVRTHSCRSRYTGQRKEVEMVGGHMTEFQKNCFDKSTKKLSHSVTGSEVDTEAEMAQ